MNRCRIRHFGKLGACGMMGAVLVNVDMMKRAVSMGLEPCVDQRLGMNLYRFEEGENVWNTFFQQPFNDDNMDGVELSMDFILQNAAMYPLGFDSVSSHGITSPNNEVFFRDSSAFFKKTVRLSHLSNDYYSKIRNRYGPLLNGFYDCMYFRGTDKHNEVLEPDMNKYLEAYDKTEKSLPLVVQTDDQRFVDFVSSAYPGCFVIEDFKVSTNQRPLHIGNRENPKLRRQNGLEIIAISQVLANSQNLILNRSNVSTASCLFRSSLKGVTMVNQ